MHICQDICKFYCLNLDHSNMFQAFDGVVAMVLKYNVLQLQNFVLNEAPNNNDVKRIVNIVLNEAPNSNVHLTAVGTQQFLMVAIYPSCRKADLPETRDNNTVTRRYVWVEINFAIERMEAIYSVVQVVGRLVWAGRQAVRQKFLRFDNFNSANSEAYSSCLNRFMVLIA